MNILEELPQDWRDAIRPYYSQEEGKMLAQALEAEYANDQEIYPPRECIFAALRATPLNCVKAVWIGQDPYHGPQQANGMAFAVQKGTPLPPSLKNIFKEYASDLGREMPQDSSLENWAKAGVLLMNTVLTVRSGIANSHKKLGWQKLTGAIFRAVSAKQTPVAFILLGNNAAAFREMIDERRHVVFQAAHPSPLSANRGFFGSRLFSRVNAMLAQRGAEPIEW